MSLVQTPPPTIPDTFAIAATAVAIDVPTPLAQSVAYTHYIPVIVVCLAACYASVYIMRCIYWHYRRRRKRQLWFERGRLRLFWIQVTARQQERQQQGHLEEKLLTEDDLPTTTHDISSYAPQLPPRPATFPNHTNNLSSISLFTPSSSLSSSYSYILDGGSRAPPPPSILSPNMSPSLSSSNNTVSATILPRRHSVIGTTPMGGCYYDSSTTLAELSLSTSRSLSQRQQPKEREKQRRDSSNSNTSATSTLISTTRNSMTKKWRYWTQNKKKRRKLIWQWSVAMGYCQYTHANRIDYLVHQLQQQQRHQQQRQGEKQPIEQDITDQDEKKALVTSLSSSISSYSSSSSSYHHNLIM